MTNREFKCAMLETMYDEHRAFRALITLCCSDKEFINKFDAWSEARMKIAKGRNQLEHGDDYGN